MSQKNNLSRGLTIRWPSLFVAGFFLIGLEFGFQWFAGSTLQQAGIRWHAAFGGVVLISVSLCISAVYAAFELERIEQRQKILARSSQQIDDLTQIEGIGPKFSRTLIAAEIKTFHQLARTTEFELRKTLKQAGFQYAPGIDTWAQQAELAARQDWNRLREYQDILKSAPQSTEESPI